MWNTVNQICLQYRSYSVYQGNRSVADKVRSGFHGNHFVFLMVSSHIHFHCCILHVILVVLTGYINTLRQNGRRFADDVFKCIFLNENIWISIKITLKFVPKGPVNNIPALVQIMAWRRTGDKPLYETMMASLLTHICVTRPQWVKIVPILHDDIIKWKHFWHYWPFQRGIQRWQVNSPHKGQWYGALMFSLIPAE